MARQIHQDVHFVRSDTLGQFPAGNRHRQVVCDALAEILGHVVGSAAHCVHQDLEARWIMMFEQLRDEFHDRVVVQVGRYITYLIRRSGSRSLACGRIRLASGAA